MGNKKSKHKENYKYRYRPPIENEIQVGILAPCLPSSPYHVCLYAKSSGSKILICNSANYKKKVDSKFQFGKISSKELITEILSYSSEIKIVLYLFLYYTNKNLRLLLTENFLWVRN